MSRQVGQKDDDSLKCGFNMRRLGFTFIELLVVLAIGVIMVTMVSHVFYRAVNHEGRKPACAGNLRLIARAVRQYAQDHDGKFLVLFSQGTSGWSTALQPRLKSWQIFQCPSTERKASGSTDYYLNANLPQLKAVVQAPHWMILAGEGVDDSPPNYSMSELPKARGPEARSPAQRHLDGSNYAFADGHVKWLEPGKVGDMEGEGQAFFTTR